MDTINQTLGGALIIVLFLLIGLTIVGCMVCWNRSHREQCSSGDSGNIRNGDACIYEKNNQRASYNRSSNAYINNIGNNIYIYNYFAIDQRKIPFSYLIRHIFRSFFFCSVLFFPIFSFIDHHSKRSTIPTAHRLGCRKWFHCSKSSKLMWPWRFQRHKHANYEPTSIPSTVSNCILIK